MSNAYGLREVRMQHPNARLTARGRLELVLLVEREGATFRHAAATFRCSVSTTFEWVSRRRRASIGERFGLGGASPTARHVPAASPGAWTRSPRRGWFWPAGAQAGARA